jgi:hypothetical protein
LNVPASPRLSHNLKPRDHAHLVTLEDARRYMLELPAELANRNVWQHAAVLAIEAGEQPTRAVLATLTAQLNLALFTTYRLEF